MPNIETVYIQNFRNHKHIQIDFKKGINVIWGENGSGKTAILEVVYTLSMGRSFRTRNHKETLKENADHQSLKGVFNSRTDTTEIKINQISSGQRRLFVNNIVLTKVKDLIGETPIVLLSPEEQLLTKGSPGDRRNYFDRIFSTISQEYLNILLAYQKLVKQRNALLQEIRREPAKLKAIEAWNEPLVSAGKKLYKIKNVIIRQFILELEIINNKYSKNDVELTIEFVPDGSAETLEKRLEKSLNLDLAKGWTTTGPHRDDYGFLFNGRMLKKYGSQGEHKLALVLIKMAEIRAIKNKTGKTPILMLDDFFDKLDFQRADEALSLLNGDYQTIITTTDIIDVKKHGINLSSTNNTIFHLKRTCKA